MSRKKLGYYCLYCNKLNDYRGSSCRNTFCNNKCQGHYRREKWLEDNYEKFVTGQLTARNAYKKYVKERDGENCAICGQEPMHNGKKLTMILDHIDGDASHNMPENFRLVCPNCDSQLPTFKSRNTGNGRATKGMKWYSSL